MPDHRLSGGPGWGVLRAPREVLFGVGVADATGQLSRRLADRVLVVTDPTLAAGQAAQRVLASLRSEGLEVDIFDGAVQELPMHVVIEAIREAAASRPQCVVGLGGGSSIDLAKLVALGMRHGDELPRFYGEEQVPGPTAPVIAIPTTAGTGSEVTPVAVLTDPEVVLKVGISSRHLIPTYAIVDPTMTYGCPPSVTGHAGIDALAHAVEAFTAARRHLPAGSNAVFVGKNSLSDGFALVAIRHIAPNLVAARRDEPDARAAVAYGSLCAGLAFGTAGTAVAHALQYALGARTHTPHGLGTGLLLPYAMHFNYEARVGELAAIGRAMGVSGEEHDDEQSARQAIAAVAALAIEVGVPPSLASLHVAEEELPQLARQALGVSRLIANNPRALGERALVEILDAAWRGDLAPWGPAAVS
jgi:alcohol dehydrogenase class IV